MFSRIRRHVNYATVTLTLVLVFVMSGGAYAASKYLITSTKQIKPSVLTQLKGKTGSAGAKGAPGEKGPAGPAGANGKDGAQGPAGEKGSAGSEGIEGPAGVAGKEGKEGKVGPAGPEGVCSTANCVLPKGTSETGVWALRDIAKAEGEHRITALSFPIRLKSSITHTQFVPKGAATLPPGCKGTVEVPEAEPGYLCVFEGEAAMHAGGLSTPFFIGPSGEISDTSPTGVELLFETTIKPAKAGEEIEVSSEGSWVVTAE